MPLGIANLNTLSRYVAAGGGGGLATGDDVLTSLSSVNWNRAQYYTYNLSYAGTNSSGNPVVAMAYIDESALTTLKAVLIEIDATDLTITQGTPETIYTGSGGGDPQEAPVMMTENGDTDYCSVVWLDRVTPYYVYARAAQMDLDNLSFTWGSQVTVASSSIDTMAIGAYVGNANYVMGNRLDGGRYFLVSRSGTSLTVGTNASAMSNANVYNNTLGFDNSGSIYRFVRTNSTGSVSVAAAYYNSGSASSIAYSTPITGVSSVIFSQSAKLNSSNKGIIIATDNSITKANAYEITWPSSGTSAPTISSGTAITLTDDVYGDRSVLASSTTDDQAYLLHQKSDTNWYLNTLTASGTTVSETGVSSLSTLTSSQRTGFDAITCAAGGNEFLIGVFDNSGSNNPDMYVRVM